MKSTQRREEPNFAKMLGISRQYLCDLEHDRRSVSLEKAAQFARYTGYSEDQMVRLALQDCVNKAGLHYEVDIQKEA